MRSSTPCASISTPARSPLLVNYLLCALAGTALVVAGIFVFTRLARCPGA